MSSGYNAVVIGGGVTGCSILWHLAKRGAGRLLLLERDTIGSGSTGRSSGIIRMHYSTEVNTRLALESLPVFLNWHDTVGEGDAGWTHTGFMVISDEAYLPELRKNVDLQQRCGVDTSIIPNDEAREIAPMFVIGEGDAVAYEPGSGYGDPSGTAMGYLAASRRMGAEARLGMPVSDIEIEAGRVKAVLAGGERFETHTAVIATGPWSQRIMRRLGHELPLQATRHQVIMLRRPVGEAPMHPGGADFANQTYFRPEAGNLTLLGNGNIEYDADPDDYDPGVQMEYVSEVWSRLTNRMPVMESAEFTHGYAGLYTTTPDVHPVIDRVPGAEGAYICTGFSGHGFKLAPAVGRCVSELVLDGRSSFVDIDGLGMSRFASGELNLPQGTFKVMA